MKKLLAIILAVSAYGQVIHTVGIGQVNAPNTVEAFGVGASGVTFNACVKLDGSTPEKVVINTTADHGCYGIAQGSISSGGFVQVTRLGQTIAIADGAITQGHLLVASSTTGGYVHDYGTSDPTAVSSGTQIVGIALASAGGSGATFPVTLAPSTAGSSGGGGGGAGVCSASNSGAPNTLTCAISSFTLATGSLVNLFVTNATTSTTVTLNINSGGAVTILRGTGNSPAIGQIAPSSEPILLSYNGTNLLIVDDTFEAGPTGCLTASRTSYPWVYDINTACVPELTAANVWTGYNNLSGGQLRLPESTVGSLPTASSNTGKEFLVTDGASASDCSTGGGSTLVNMCRSNGTSWVFIGASGGGGTGSKLLYSATNTTPVTCNGSQQALDTYSMPANTAAVGNVIHVHIEFAKTGTAAGSLFTVGLGGTVSPACCNSGSSSDTTYTIDAPYTVAGTSSELVGGMALAYNGSALPLARLAGNGTSAITGTIAITANQNCTSPDTGAISAWSVVLEK